MTRRPVSASFLSLAAIKARAASSGDGGPPAEGDKVRKGPSLLREVGDPVGEAAVLGAGQRRGRGADQRARLGE